MYAYICMCVHACLYVCMSVCLLICLCACVCVHFSLSLSLYLCVRGGARKPRKSLFSVMLVAQTFRCLKLSLGSSQISLYMMSSSKSAVISEMPEIPWTKREQIN